VYKVSIDLKVNCQLFNVGYGLVRSFFVIESDDVLRCMWIVCLEHSCDFLFEFLESFEVVFFVFFKNKIEKLSTRKKLTASVSSSWSSGFCKTLFAWQFKDDFSGFCFQKTFIEFQV
jgi:hypothetical protein